MVGLGFLGKNMLVFGVLVRSWGRGFQQGEAGFCF